jgi:hypothetical protein
MMWVLIRLRLMCTVTALGRALLMRPGLQLDTRERTTPPGTGTQHNRALPKPNTHHGGGINAAPQPKEQTTGESTLRLQARPH